jgi:hypothetical protein
MNFKPMEPTFVTWDTNHQYIIINYKDQSIWVNPVDALHIAARIVRRVGERMQVDVAPTKG